MQTEKDFEPFKLSSDDSKLGSNNSNESKASILSLDKSNNDLKKELLTIEEMKKNCCEKNNGSCEDNNLYDLDERANYLKIVKILKDDKISNKDKISSFNNIMYKLSYEDRINLLKEYKNLFDNDDTQKKYPKAVLRQEKRLKEVFISLLKDIMNKNAEQIKDSFSMEYYVDLQSSNIPFLEGSEEFVFANLINDAFDTFITRSNYPTNQVIKHFDEIKYLSNIINKGLKKPQIAEAKIAEINNLASNMESKMEIEDNNENEIENKNKKIKNSFDSNKFTPKKRLLKPIFEKYCSKEFQKKYKEYLDENPMYNKDKKIKYIYEIVLESLFFYCLFFNELGKIKLMSSYADIFYEYEDKKIEVLKDYKFIKNIKDMNGKIVNVSNGLKNKNYIISIEDNIFVINFYDYNIELLFLALSNANRSSMQNIQNILDDMQYWTIQKFARVNSLYKDNNLNELFKKEIDTMLSHQVLENLFNQIIMFEDYEYPFKKPEFFKQVHESILYIKLPTKMILGLTIKKMGIIIINRGRYDDLINEQKNKNVKFSLKLSECAFNKITLLHEINFHYFLVILYSNRTINYLNTPEKVFRNYSIQEKMDFGEKGEAIIFGNKVKELYIQAIINIINLKLWNENCDKNPYYIGKKFLELNKETTGKITIDDLKNINEFTELLYEIINKDTDASPFILDSDIGFFFSRGKIMDLDCDDDSTIDESDIESKSFATIFPRGMCLNACRYYYS